MGETIEYRVSRVGQFWQITGGDQSQLGFPSLAAALAAADLLVAAHRACGVSALVLIRDEAGRLVPAVTGRPATARRSDGDGHTTAPSA